ncbi:MAG TPA: cell division protein FtsL [Candidatus Aquabacterium excrementipullorum]|nr:cell division protein FtsL [Candidatus Aquabacterium excrementipullorum]
MTRLNIALAIVLLLSCFWLIRSSNEARGLFVQLERAQVREQELQVDFERLKIERRTAATPLVVEDMVRQKLRMFNATPGVTHYVSDSAGAQASGAAAAAGSSPAASSLSASPSQAGGAR